MESDSLVRFTQSNIWRDYLEANDRSKSDVPASPRSSPTGDCKSFASEQDLSKSHRQRSDLASENEDLVALTCHKADSIDADSQQSDHAEVVLQQPTSKSHSEVDAADVAAPGKEENSHIVVSIPMSSESVSHSQHEM